VRAVEQELVQTGLSPPLPGELVFHNVLQHHVHVLVEASKRANKFFITLEEGLQVRETRTNKVCIITRGTFIIIQSLLPMHLSYTNRYINSIGAMERQN
jgi:hypothetical protein